MVRTVALVSLLAAAVVHAQAVRNRVERANDKQDLRQDNRQLADDRLDAVRAAQLLADYDAAASRNDVARLGQLDGAFDRYLAKEIAESRVESAQDRQEVREDRREVRSDRREIAKPGNGRDDVRDATRDQVNLADDRRDRANERVTRERLVAIQTQLRGLAGRFDAGTVGAKRGLYGEVLWFARKETVENKQEKAEDKRELREDRRERREDRRGR